MSRKRGKKQKAAVEAIPVDILAEGSGPVGRTEGDTVATVEEVATTEDIATTEDVVTSDDVVATAADPARAAGHGARKRRKRNGRNGRHESAGDDAAEGELAPGDPSHDGEGNGAVSATDAASLDAASSPADPADPAGPEDLADPEAEDTEGASAGTTEDTTGDTTSEDAAFDGAAFDGAAELDAAGADVAGAGGVAEGDAEARADGEGDGDGDGGEGDEDDAGVVFPTSAASMDAAQFKHLVEALIFASDRPLTVQRLRQLTRVGEVRRLEQALAEITEDYRERGLILQQVSGGYQFRTRTQFSAWVQQLIAGRPVRLSRAQLETLAIIAYRQPITRPEIDDIRGVDSTATLKLLMDRMLVRVLGKREEVGRPMIYGTTKEFLDFFSLGDLRELPTLREYSELTAESRKVMSERLGIAADGEGGDGSSGGSSGSGNDGGGDGGDSEGGLGGGGGDGGGPMPGFESGDGAVSDDGGAPASATAADLADALATFYAAADAVDQSNAAAVAEPEDHERVDERVDEPDDHEAVDEVVDELGGLEAGDVAVSEAGGGEAVSELDMPVAAVPLVEDLSVAQDDSAEAERVSDETSDEASDVMSDEISDEADRAAVSELDMAVAAGVPLAHDNQSDGAGASALHAEPAAE